MNDDLLVIEGFGLCLNDLVWIDDEDAIESMIADAGYNSIAEYIENEIHKELEYFASDHEQYIYVPTICPTVADIIGTKIWAREELADEIYNVLKDFIKDDESIIADLLDHVLYWEVN